MTVHVIDRAATFAPDPEPSIPYLEGFRDALDEPPEIVAVRIAWAWEHAAPEWADQYAAGALEVHIARLATTIDTPGAEQ